MSDLAAIASREELIAFLVQDKLACFSPKSFPKSCAVLSYKNEAVIDNYCSRREASRETAGHILQETLGALYRLARAVGAGMAAPAAPGWTGNRTR